MPYIAIANTDVGKRYGVQRAHCVEMTDVRIEATEYESEFDAAEFAIVMTDLYRCNEWRFEAEEVEPCT